MRVASARTHIEWLRDHDPGFAATTVVLTGSSADALTAAAGVLAGRRGQIVDPNHTVLPVGFRTFADLIREDLPDRPRLGLSGMRGGASYLPAGPQGRVSQRSRASSWCPRADPGRWRTTCGA